MKKKGLILAAFMLSLHIAGAQNLPQGDLSYKVKDEAFSRSGIPVLSAYMTDMMGSRLEGSRMKLRAESLAVDMIRKMGIPEVRIENAGEFSRGGWDVVRTYAAMTSPYYCAFAANPVAWTAGTDGLVKAECVLLEAAGVEDLEQFRGKLSGKIVLLQETRSYEMSFDPLASRLSDEQLELMKNDRRAEPASARRRSYAYRYDATLDRAISELIEAEKPLCVISGSGSFNVPSSSGARYRSGEALPQSRLILPVEDHGRMCRLLRSGEKVEMELDLRHEFSRNTELHNVIAEIPGTDPKLKDEVVLIGAHLDSWHGGTGAADNASGCIVMMEAMRIIKALGIWPRRTIRMALWGGEEQGLLGSSAYRDMYLWDKEAGAGRPGYDKFALYLNMDNGSGRFRGIYLEKNDMAFPFFEKWMQPLRPLGFEVLSPWTTGSTDHVSFDRIGLPSYQFIQDELEYDRTYHTVMDTMERLSETDLRIDACIVAWLVICAAQDEGRIPFKPVSGK